MAERLPESVYWRRRLLLLVIVLAPVLLVARACTGPDAPRPVPSGSASETATTQAATPARSSAKAKPSESSTATPTETATATEPPITACENGVIRVSVTTDAATYGIGTPVTVAMRITNAGDVACNRDVGALANEVYITDVDGAVVWSSDACQSDAKPQVVVMRPGRVFGNTQVWSGLNSGRDCSASQAAAPDATPGTYLAYARNDTVVSKPFAFTIG